MGKIHIFGFLGSVFPWASAGPSAPRTPTGRQFCSPPPLGGGPGLGFGLAGPKKGAGLAPPPGGGVGFPLSTSLITILANFFF